MTADIDAVLSRLRERPECRDAVEVIERLTAENERMTEMDEQRYRFTVTLQNDTARLHDENRRLTAERDRLREALAEVHEWALDAYHQGTDEEFEFAASNGGTYTCLSTWEEADELLPRIAALLGESPVPDEPTSDGSTDADEILGWVRAARPIQVWDPKHEAWMLATKQDRGSIQHWVRLGGSFRLAAPSHPTGEERTDGY